MTRAAVIGAGAWGTALADLLSRNGMDTCLWAREPEVAESIQKDHLNHLYLDGRVLHPALKATTDLSAAVRGAELVCSVTPSHATRRVWKDLTGLMRPGVPLVCASKGIEPESLALMCDIARETLPEHPFVALSGPSFADEVHQQQPTAVVAASIDSAAAAFTQKTFSAPRFRVYTGSDVIGVELGGALKNTMAIAAGMLEGMGLGHNPLAALLTRGLAEIARLGVSMGARTETFYGLAGMGDLVLTCTGGLSRNRQLGELLARGTTLKQYRETHRNVAEGVNAAQAGVLLAARHQVEMPITLQVAEVLRGSVTPAEGLAVLMERTLRAEDGND